MKCGVVVHGPEVIDSGEAVRVLDRLAELGEVEATLGGAMGLAALLDAGLEDRVRVVPRQLVSEALRDQDRTSDVVVLLNRSKSRESGLAFGRMVVGRVFGELGHPLVQLDQGFFVRWKGEEVDALRPLVRSLGLEELPPPPFDQDRGRRRVVHGVRVGENLWINGTVIGKAVSEEVVIELHDGQLRFEGIEVKEHGLEKLKLTDLARAIVRSGSVRRTSSVARSVKAAESDRVILVDHRAEDAIFRARGAKAAVTVGDDTTRIATALLARLGVPVVGIIDGDEDCICLDRSAAAGSVALRLRPGNDDRLGALVQENLFHGRQEMLCSEDLDSLVRKIERMAGDALVEVVKK